MRLKPVQLFGVVVVLMGALFLGACAKKKVADKMPAAPPPPAKPTATLALSQTDIQKGQQTVLTWNTNNASDVTIDGLGTVGASGSRTLTPSDSTTYNLTAKGPGGEADASARVTVNQPVAARQSEPSLADIFNAHVKDIFFDYDKYGVRAADQSIAEADAKFLAAHPDAKVLIEGHCDERGSEEYNVALGDNRADSTRDFLTKLGVNADQIKTISYGKEKPFCTTSTTDDSCLQQNRRAHFVLQSDAAAQGQ